MGTGLAVMKGVVWQLQSTGVAWNQSGMELAHLVYLWKYGRHVEHSVIDLAAHAG